MPSRRRRWYFAALAAAVLLAHLWLAQRASEWLEFHARTDALVRMEAAFVRELAPAAPPAVTAVPPAPAAQPRARAASPAELPAEPASAPKPAEPPSAAEPPQAASEPVADAPPVAEASEPASVAQDAASAASAAEPPLAAASDAASDESLTIGGFSWPPSTQMSYTLTGWVRGEVHGQAQVRWLRDGARYQVHLDVTVGPGFAPLMQRRMTSDGRITAQGLAPQRYDEQTQVAFGAPRSATLRFEPDALVLANGRRLAPMAGVQDTASQFVQLIWLMATRPQQLVPGGQVEMPLALARRQDLWIYDVVGLETLHTPFGAIDAWHLSPRREGDASTLSMEAWFAPTLQYLPARIVIRQDAQTYVDLLVDSLPRQALPAASVQSPKPVETPKQSPRSPAQ